MLKAVTSAWVGPIAASCGCQWKAWDSHSLSMVHIETEVIHVMVWIATLSISRADVRRPLNAVVAWPV
jgi:hypothetical protein